MIPEFDSGVGVLLGKGDGTFQEPSIVSPLPGPVALAAGHFTSSKNLDLAVTKALISSGAVQILLGNGDGTFSLGESYALDPSSQSIVAADFRKNGKTDLAIGEFQGPGVAVLLGNGDGTFEQPVVYPILIPSGIAAADMNGDGILDIVSGSDLVPGGSPLSAGEVGVFSGRGDGTFEPAVLYPTGVFPWALAIADFNGDRMPDITVVDYLGYREYVLLNTGVVSFSATAPLSFRRQLVDTTSGAKSTTLTNNGKSSLTISSITLGGKSFGMEATCTKSVAPGGSCSISATFTPRAQGNSNGTVSIKSSASSKPLVVDLIGAGTVVELSSTALTFGSQKVGTKSAPQNVQVTNTGSTTLVFKGPGFYPIYVTGPDYNDFSETNTCGPQDSTLAPGASCAITVQFTPTKTGARSAQIWVEDTGGSSPQTVLLTGTGS